MLVNYSSDDEGGASPIPQKKAKISGILVAPNPDADISRLEREKELQLAEERRLAIPDDLADAAKKKANNHLTGQVDRAEVDGFSFAQQYYNFQSYGYCYEPGRASERVIVAKHKHPDEFKRVVQGEKLEAKEFMLQGAFTRDTPEVQQKSRELKQKREKFGDAGSGEFHGPWAKYESENVPVVQSAPEEKERLTQAEKKRVEVVQETKKQKEFEAWTEYHGEFAERDYQGRSYIMPPSDLKPNQHTCYIPKKPIHTWQGHTKGVQTVQFFPRYGHFVLSGSLDSSIRLWSTLGNKKLTRTYHGHSEAVRDINWTWDGLHFLSAGYDKSMHYWDTETGKIVQSFRLKSYPFCVRFVPRAEHQNSFLVGSSNKKIAQYDVRTGGRTQVYEEHIGAVSTITFIEGGRKFVSTSDDKKIFVWEFGLPVVIKHFSEPESQAITQTAMHPSGRYYAGQASNNTIQIFDCKGSFRRNGKKKFMGHKTAGYSCRLCFSPDGNYIVSGDADGKAFFWDWKSQKVYRVLDAHDGVCNSLDWHPIEPSKFVTCGWDGLIKYWD